MLFETVVHGKRRLLSSHSDMSEEILFQSSAELPQAVLVPVLVPATWRPCRGTVPSLTCGRVLLESPWLGASGRMPDSSSSCSGFLFSPEGTFLCLWGFLQGKPAPGWKPCQRPKASKARREISEQQNDIVREKNMKCSNKRRVSQRTHGNCFAPGEQHLLSRQPY